MQVVRVYAVNLMPATQAAPQTASHCHDSDLWQRASQPYTTARSVSKAAAQRS